MKSLRLQHICGSIIVIKNIIFSILSIIIILFGFYACNYYKFHPYQGNDCTGIGYLLMIIVGFCGCILGFCLFAFSIAYLIFGDFLKYDKSFRKGPIITCIVFEGISLSYSCFQLIFNDRVIFNSSLFLSSMLICLIYFCIYLVFIGQSIMTLILLIKTLLVHQNELLDVENYE